MAEYSRLSGAGTSVALVGLKREQVGTISAGPLERLLGFATAAMMCGYAVFRHIDELPLEYPMLGLGVVLGAVLVRSQLGRYKAEKAGKSRDGAPSAQIADAASLQRPSS